MNKNGISLVVLIITIIVMIIMAAIVIYTGYNAPTYANRSRFTDAIDGVRVELRNFKK